MSRLTWDNDGERFYETGVKNGVLFVWDDTQNAYGHGVAWNGLTGVTQSPSGAEPTALYADDIKYFELISNEEFGCTIEAYQSPEEFDECDGSASIATGVNISGQNRKRFAFSYVTTLGNDTLGNEYGYKIHIVYGCRAGVSERSYTTINDSPEAMTLSWDVTTTPVTLTGTLAGYKPVAHLEIDSTKVDSTKLESFKDTLYGSASGESTLPMPNAVALAFA